jgi:3-hydroxyisobutyrate dehydrogenase-like beta-hydroxyacid dehydrogenase
MTLSALGWVGAGEMGLPMLRRACDAGMAVQCFDWRAPRLALAQSAGAVPVADAALLARGVARVVTMVYDDAALLRNVSWLMPGLRAGSVLMDMSTVSPSASAKVAEQLQAIGVLYLRAPVSGSAAVAEAGALSVYASGPRVAFERSLDVLQTFSSGQTYLGTGEEARVVKLAINLLVVNLTAVFGEALALGDAAGVDREVLMSCINSSVVATRHSQLRGTAMATRRYTGSGSLRLSAKDLDMALTVAPQLSLPLTRQTRLRVARLMECGFAEIEISKLADDFD